MTGHPQYECIVTQQTRSVIAWPREKNPIDIRPKIAGGAFLSNRGGQYIRDTIHHYVRWYDGRRFESFMPWFTIGVQMLSFEEREKMFGPCQVGRPVAQARKRVPIGQSVINHYAKRSRGKEWFLLCPYLVGSSRTSKRRNK